jgi:hypothetical protein
MSPDPDPPRRAVPYVLPPFREKRPSGGPGAKTWAAVGTLILLLLLAARAYMNQPREAPPIFVRVADVGPSVYAPAPAPAPAPERPANRMQVVPMTLPQAVEQAAPAAAPPLTPTPHIEGTRREVIAYVPVLDINIGIGDGPGDVRMKPGWLSVKVDGVELPGFPKRVNGNFQAKVPVTDRKLFRAVVTLRYSDRSFNQGEHFEVSPGKVDHWTINSNIKKYDEGVASMAVAVQDPLKRPDEYLGIDPQSDRFSR